MEARLYGAALGLRKKEFDLLYLLADRHPVAQSREMIATRVWGTEHVSDNSIDVTASRLRDKLGAALSEGGPADGETKPWVETIRGVGYRLVLGPTD